MSLPSQEVLDEINNLITEVTGFQDSDENFTICQRYCLSHVVHHTYPFFSKTTVNNMISSYISRFYGHGYFKVSQELENQVKSFLNNEKLFEKNPQYDIQWSLLSLLSSLSSNLTSLKKLPELLPIDEEENETEDFDWKEYLTSDLPQNDLSIKKEDEESSQSSNENDSAKEEEKEEVCTEIVSTEDEKSSQNKKNIEIIFDNKILFEKKSLSESRKQKVKEFLRNKKSKGNLEADIQVWGNITEKLDELLYKEGIIRKSQLVSEFEVMENILFQLQTGERIFARKGLENPALTSLTQETLGSYLESLKPYFRIIRSFEEFNHEITEVRYPEVNLDKSFVNENKSVGNIKRKIPNVLYMYNVMLRKSLEPFQRKVTEIVENLENYTLLQMEGQLRQYYSDLISLYYVHNLATKNWKNDSNWMTSIRILSVLYNSIMEANSSRLSFLYLNFFLNCFQVYLEVIDSWISFLDLIDPNDEFIIVKSDNLEKSERCSDYEIRPYKIEMENIGVKNVAILDLISEKMVQVGQSLEVLRRLNRFVTEKTEAFKETFHKLLIKSINEKIQQLSKIKTPIKISKQKSPEKQRSIFTMKNVGLISMGSHHENSFEIGDFLTEILKDEDKKQKETPPPKETETETECKNHCTEFIHSMVENRYFKMAFDNIGPKQVQQQLKEAKQRVENESKNDAMVIRTPDDGGNGIYPLNKIITESFYEILRNRISGACALVKDIVLKECNLPLHLALLRSILLFNDSYLIQPFFMSFFTQPFIWGSSYSLSFHLKECVRNVYKDQVNLLSVRLTKEQTECENILKAIDAITVNYEVKWPLTLIITSEGMMKYNEIFRLAMKLKWVHWAFCNLHFQSKDETEKCLKSTQHRLRLLRFWLLSTLGRINNYFMTQMTAPDLDLSSCNDLKEIIQKHSEFLENIHENCLLGKKSSDGRKLIQETLMTLCMDVLLEGENITEAKLSLIEKNFARCHLSISHLLHLLD